MADDEERQAESARRGVDRRARQEFPHRALPRRHRRGLSHATQGLPEHETFGLRTVPRLLHRRKKTRPAHLQRSHHQTA